MKKFYLAVLLLPLLFVSFTQDVKAQKYIRVNPRSLDFGEVAVGTFGTPLKLNISIVDPDAKDAVGTASFATKEDSFLIYGTNFYPYPTEQDPIPKSIYFKPLEVKEYTNKLIITYKDEKVEIVLKGKGLDPENPYGLSEENPVVSVVSGLDDISWGPWKQVKKAGNKEWKISPWGSESKYASFTAKDETGKENEVARTKLIYNKAIDCDKLAVRKFFISTEVVNPQKKSGLYIYLSDKKDAAEGQTSLLYLVGNSSLTKKKMHEIDIPTSVTGKKFLIIEAWGENNAEGNSEWRLSGLRLGLAKPNPRLEIEQKELFCGTMKIGDTNAYTASIKILAKDKPHSSSKITVAFEKGKDSPFSSSQKELYPWSDTMPAVLSVQFKAKKEGLNEDNLILTFAEKVFKVRLVGQGLNAENPFQMDEKTAVKELKEGSFSLDKGWTSYAMMGNYTFKAQEKDGKSWMEYDFKKSIALYDESVLLSPTLYTKNLEGGVLRISMRLQQGKDEKTPRFILSLIDIKDSTEKSKKLLELDFYASENMGVKEAKEYVGDEFKTVEIPLTKELIPEGDLTKVKIFVKGSVLMKKMAVWQIEKCEVKGNFTPISEVRRNNPLQVATAKGYLFLDKALTTEPIYIYTLQGLLIQKLQGNTSYRVALSQGVYLVKMGAKVLKVQIQE